MPVSRSCPSPGEVCCAYRPTLDAPGVFRATPVPPPAPAPRRGSPARLMLPAELALLLAALLLAAWCPRQAEPLPPIRKPGWMRPVAAPRPETR